LLVLGAAFIAVGCGSSNKDSGGSGSELAKDQTFTIVGVEPKTLDPAVTTVLDDLNTQQAFFAPLYRLTGKDSELTPYLADGLPEVSNNGLTYTVKLRDDAKWSDGTPITADDLVWSMKRALDPKTGAGFAGFFTSIVGACEYNGGDPKKCGPNPTDGSADALGIKAVDDHTVQIDLAKQVPWFKLLLATGPAYPLPRKSIEKYGEKWVEPGNIITSGPFKLQSWKHKQELVGVKSSTFFNHKDITLDKIVFKIIPNTKTALRQFTAGKVDAGFRAKLIGPADIDKYKSDDRYISSETSSTNYMWMNTRNAKLKDPKVRQGIALAIDRKSIVDNITKRGDTILTTMIPNIMPGYDAIKGDQLLSKSGKPDQDRARELLKEGGWKASDSFNLYYTTESATGESIAQAVQSDLGKVGVDVKIVPVPTSDEFFSVGIGLSPVDSKVDGVLAGWGADYLDGQDYYQLVTCGQIAPGNNTANYCNPQFDKRYDSALTVVDDDARFAIYKDLETMLTGKDGEFPFVPFYSPRDDTLRQTWVQGFEFIPSQYDYYDDIKIMSH